MFTAGRALNGPSWMDGFPFVVPVESEQEAREEVRRQTRVYDPLLWNEWTVRVDLDGPRFQHLLTLLDRPGVAVDPNLVVFESIVWSAVPALRRRPAFLLPADAEATGAAPHPATASWTAAGFDSVRSAWPVFLEMIRRFHGAGILLTAGSDFGNAWLTPGAAFHRELVLLASAGIPSLDVLTIATRNAAAVLGATRRDRRGCPKRPGRPGGTRPGPP